MFKRLFFGFLVCFSVQSADCTLVDETCEDVLRDKQDQFSSIVREINSAMGDDPSTNELLDLELRAIRLLREAPNVIFDSIGANFGMYVTDKHLAQDTKASRINPEIARRELILKHSPTTMAEGDWDLVSDYYADADLMQFFAALLTRLKVAPPEITYELKPGQLRPLTSLFLQRAKPEMPSAFTLLEHSRFFRQAFPLAVKAKKKIFRGTLKTLEGRQAAAKLVDDRVFGNPQLFMLEWIMQQYIMVAQSAGHYGVSQSRTSFVEHMSQSMDDIIKGYEDVQVDGDELTDSRVANFTLSYHIFLSSRAPWYLASEVRQALIEGLHEHHQLLMGLLRPHHETVTEHADELMKEWVHSHHDDAPQVLLPDHSELDLELYIQGKRPLTELSPDKTYFVQFKRDFGLRKKIHFVRFTKRALAELVERQQKSLDQFSATAWLDAFRMGFAPRHGSRGIKLLQGSPITDMPHLNMEVKLLQTPWRWLGTVDSSGNYLLDGFKTLSSL